MIATSIIVAFASFVTANGLVPESATESPDVNIVPVSLGPVQGKVESYTLPNCNEAIRLGKKHVYDMAPDTCLGLNTAASFRIRVPAICANGTRALLGRFEGRRCNKGESTVENGLIPIDDSDIDQCISIAPEDYEREEGRDGLASLAFYCDGRRQTDDDDEDDSDKDKEPKGPKKGSYSRNACIGRDGRMRAPTFQHPLPDTCQNLPSGQPLKIYSAATCEDGSPAKLAVWNGEGCFGHHQSLTGVGDGSLKKCLSIGDSDDEPSSFAFWCTGDIQRKGSRGGGEPRRGSGIGQLILVLFLIGLFGLVAFALALLRWASIVQQLMKIFRPKQGAIAL